MERYVSFISSCLLQHVFNKYPVPFGGVVDEHMDVSTEDLAILNDEATAHDCVKYGPTFSYGTHPSFLKTIFFSNPFPQLILQYPFIWQI